MIPYVVLYTYWTYILRYLTVGGPHAIYRIVIDDLYINIASDPPNTVYVFLISMCP
jgi:hypothetical protein